MHWVEAVLVANVLGIAGIIWQGGKLAAQISHLATVVEKLTKLVEDLNKEQAALKTRVSVLEALKGD